MESSNLKELYSRFLENKCTPEEVALLLHQFDMEGDEVALKAMIRHHLASDFSGQEHVRQEWKPILQDTYEAISKNKQTGVTQESENHTGNKAWIYRRKWRLYSTAAAFALLIATGGFIFFNNRQPEVSRHTEVVKHQDLPPGGNKAVLTLANGKKIALNTVQKGIVMVQGNAHIVKLNNGQLAYNKASSSSNPQNEVVYNTISTPRGGQYEVVLSDGTKVWLNAQSSIRFPSAFSGDARKVEITGEAYFEVASLPISPDEGGQSAIPFIVKVDGMTVKVLGTHFNIMAYKNEPLSKVTLLEGAVRVKKGRQNIILEPGQQAQLNRQGRLHKNDNVDLHGAIAWKNNQFWFNNDDIQTVMRKISRWYDIDVVIEGNIPQHFVGTIPRDVNVSKIFHVLQATSHIDYTIKGNKMIVSPTPSTSLRVKPSTSLGVKK